jgi:hypothetical protein
LNWIKWLLLGLVFTMGFAAGWTVKFGDRHEATRGTTRPFVESVRISRPVATSPNGREWRHLRVVRAIDERHGPIEFVPTDPTKTWLIELGNYGKSGWVRFTLQEE